MISNDWIFTLETRIFNRVKKETEQKLKTKYPTIFYTSSGKNNGKPIYPTVYIHELGGVEQGNDLNGETINAVLETIQIEVVTDTSQLDARNVMKEIALSMKGMRFSIVSMPEFDNGNTYYRLVSRCQRVIGSEEEL